MPPGWEETTLGEACRRGGGDIQTGPFGSQLHASDYVADGIPSIMPQNIGDNRVVETEVARITPHDAARLSRYLVRPGDIVYSRRGDVEKRALIREHEAGWLCGTGCLRIRFGEADVDPAYASYYLGHPQVRAWITQHAHGATMPNLNTEILSETPFVVPPLEEQRRIAGVLGVLDDKIELNRRTSQTFESMARALFKSWFVDFDPVRAKADGRDPGMPPELAAMFPGSLEDGESGEVPSGWRLAPLPDLIEVSPARALRNGAVAPYLDMASVSVNGHSPDGVIDRAFTSGTRFINGDTLIARITPCLENGKTAYVDFLCDGEVGWGSTEFIVLRPRPPVPTEFAYCLARTDEFREFAIQSMTGSSGRQRVPVESLSGFYVARPSDDVARQFGREVEPLLANAAGADKEARALRSLRDALLPKLLAGELSVRQSEADSASANA
jgi:type I restriction enzyme S subunit